METELEFEETFRQVYAGNNCIFSGGVVFNHPYDTVYFALQKDGEGGEPTRILLTEDEAVSVILCLSSALWSVLIEQRQARSQENSTLTS